jgi:hypothetical protein
LKLGNTLFNKTKPYKNTFFKEYRVQFPAVDHGTAKVVSVFLYGSNGRGKD